MAKERTPSTSHRQKLAESMQILAKGVTHGVRGETGSYLSSVVAGLVTTVGALVDSFKGTPGTSPGPMDLGAYDEDSIIPISVVPGPPGATGATGAAGAAGAGANVPVSIDPEDHEMIPFAPPGPAGAAGANGATGSTGASGGGNSACNFRLTLSSGNPVYIPQAATPSSTDTTAETCTFAAAHGWTDGTIVTVSATIGGLTTGTRYYIHKVSTTVVSFHTTVAGAIAGTSPVNLTANITSQVIPSGVSHTSLWFSPFMGNQISLYDGANWASTASAEVSVAMGTMSSATAYHVYCQLTGGVLVLSLVAWNSNTDWATGLALQDGVYVRSSDHTMRLVGDLYSDSTTTTILDWGGIASNVGGKCYLVNLYNQMLFPLKVIDLNGGARWSYNTATIRQANGNAGNQIDVLVTSPWSLVYASIKASYTTSANNNLEGSVGIGVDSTTTFIAAVVPGTRASGDRGPTQAEFEGYLAAGHHALSWNEIGSGNAGTISWASTAAIYPRTFATSSGESSVMSAEMMA